MKIKLLVMYMFVVHIMLQQLLKVLYYIYSITIPQCKLLMKELID